MYGGQRVGALGFVALTFELETTPDERDLVEWYSLRVEQRMYRKVSTQPASVLKPSCDQQLRRMDVIEYLFNLAP